MSGKYWTDDQSAIIRFGNLSGSDNTFVLQPSDTSCKKWRKLSLKAQHIKIEVYVRETRFEQKPEHIRDYQFAPLKIVHHRVQSHKAFLGSI